MVLWPSFHLAWLTWTPYPRHPSVWSWPHPFILLLPSSSISWNQIPYIIYHISYIIHIYLPINISVRSNVWIIKFLLTLMLPMRWKYDLHTWHSLEPASFSLPLFQVWPFYPENPIYLVVASSLTLSVCLLQSSSQRSPNHQIFTETQIRLPPPSPVAFPCWPLTLSCSSTPWPCPTCLTSLFSQGLRDKLLCLWPVILLSLLDTFALLHSPQPGVTCSARTVDGFSKGGDLTKFWTWYPPIRVGLGLDFSIEKDLKFLNEG
jgi:hypothetical protein